MHSSATNSDYLQKDTPICTRMILHMIVHPIEELLVQVLITKIHEQHHFPYLGFDFLLSIVLSFSFKELRMGAKEGRLAESTGVFPTKLVVPSQYYTSFRTSNMSQASSLSRWSDNRSSASGHFVFANTTLQLLSREHSLHRTSLRHCYKNYLASAKDVSTTNIAENPQYLMI